MSAQRPSGKTMSSRLMAMKFMQRAAASTPPDAPASLTSSAESSPSKRQKTFHNPVPATTPKSEQQIIQDAAVEEEKKRERAIERLAAEAGETKWVLSTVCMNADESAQELRIQIAGYSDIDQDAWKPAAMGRRSFGNFNREVERSTSDEPSSSNEETPNNSDEYGDGGDDPAGTERPIQVSKEEGLKYGNSKHIERKQKRNEDKAEIARLAEKRRRKEIKLNGLASISEGGGASSKPSSGEKDKSCYECGEKGHERRDCQQKGKRRKLDGSAAHLKGSRPHADG